MIPWKTSSITRPQQILPISCIEMSSMTTSGKEPNGPNADLATKGAHGKQGSAIIDKEEKQEAKPLMLYSDPPPFIPEEFRSKPPSEMSYDERIEEIRRQLEYYFSPLNVVHDKFMKKTMGQTDFALPIQVLATFFNLKFLEATCEDIKEAAERSERLMWVDPVPLASIEGLSNKEEDPAVKKPAKRGRKPKALVTAEQPPVPPVPASEGFIAPTTPYKSLEPTELYDIDTSIFLNPVDSVLPTRSLAKLVRSLLQGQDFRIVRQLGGSNKQMGRLDCILEFMTAEDRDAVINGINQLEVENRLGIKTVQTAQEWSELRTKRFMESRKIVIIESIQKNVDPGVLHQYVRSILGADAYITRIEAQNGHAFVLITNGVSALKLVESLEAQFDLLRQMPAKDLAESELGAMFKTTASTHILRSKGFRREIVHMNQFIAERRKSRMEKQEKPREARKDPERDI